MAGSYGFTLSGLPAGGFDIELRGEKIGRLVRGDPQGWVSKLTPVDHQAEIPPPFARFEHGFKSLIDALDWMGNPPVKRGR